MKQYLYSLLAALLRAFLMPKQCQSGSFQKMIITILLVDLFLKENLYAQSIKAFYDLEALLKATKAVS